MLALAYVSVNLNSPLPRPVIKNVLQPFNSQRTTALHRVKLTLERFVHGARRIVKTYLPWLAEAERLQGICDWLSQNPAAAQRLWQGSLESAEARNQRYDQAQTHLEMGQRLGDASHIACGEALLGENGANAPALPNRVRKSSPPHCTEKARRTGKNIVEERLSLVRRHQAAGTQWIGRRLASHSPLLPHRSSQTTEVLQSHVSHQNNQEQSAQHNHGKIDWLGFGHNRRHQP
jgi:hypothetical protein